MYHNIMYNKKKISSIFLTIIFLWITIAWPVIGHISSSLLTRFFEIYDLWFYCLQILSWSITHLSFPLFLEPINFFRYPSNHNFNEFYQFARNMPILWFLRRTKSEQFFIHYIISYISYKLHQVNLRINVIESQIKFILKSNCFYYVNEPLWFLYTNFKVNNF